MMNDEGGWTTMMTKYATNLDYGFSFSFWISELFFYSGRRFLYD